MASRPPHIPALRARGPSVAPELVEVRAALVALAACADGDRDEPCAATPASLGLTEDAALARFLEGQQLALILDHHHGRSSPAPRSRGKAMASTEMLATAGKGRVKL
jgi:hypothetical protein